MSDESQTKTYQRPDGRPKNTGATLHESVARVVVDDDSTRSNYTIHVEHPDYDGGTRCFHRTDREMVVSGIQKHLDNFTDAEMARVDVVDRAELALGETELLPDSYGRSGPFAPETPSVEVAAE